MSEKSWDQVRLNSHSRDGLLAISSRMATGELSPWVDMSNPDRVENLTRAIGHTVGRDVVTEAGDRRKPFGLGYSVTR